MNAAGVGDVLRQLGVVVREQPRPSCSQFALWAAGLTTQLSVLWPQVSEGQLHKMIAEFGVDDKGLVAAADFVREQGKNAPTQVLTPLPPTVS